MPSGEQEMLNDIMELLRRRSTPEMPLVDLFMSILRGEGTRVQRSRFGHAKADTMRKIIVQVIEQYAQQTQNWQLLRLLDRFRDFERQPPRSRPPQAPTAEAAQARLPARRAGLPEHRGCAGEAREERVHDGPGQGPAAVAGATATRPVVAVSEPPRRCAGEDGRGRRADEAGGEVCAWSGVRQVSRHAGTGWGGVRVGFLLALMLCAAGRQDVSCQHSATD